MIKLVELLHTESQDDEDQFVSIDNWNWTEVDHLATMGFAFY